MNKKQVALLVLAASLGAFTLGEVVMKRAILKNLEKHRPLINKIITDVMLKAHADEMTPEEYRRYLDENVDFMKIVMS